MEKFWIILLIVVILSAGYWLAVGNSTSNNLLIFSEKKQSNLLLGPSAQKPENKTLESAQEVDNKVITNKEENKKIMTAILHTNKGNITITFNSSTPKTVENFITLTKNGFYDGTKFHRVIKGFMSQGGDPLSKNDSKKSSWGTGGPGYKFNDEITDTNSNDLGTIAMANAGPNTNGSQFFINAAANNFLDTKHTVFCKVTSGLDVALAINSVKTDSEDKPIDSVILKSITLK